MKNYYEGRVISKVYFGDIEPEDDNKLKYNKKLAYFLDMAKFNEILITEFVHPTIKLKTQYGFISGYEWIRNEKERIEKNTSMRIGCCWDGCKKIALYKGNDNDIEKCKPDKPIKLNFTLEHTNEKLN